MSPILQLAGTEHTLQLFGIKLLGINAENGRKFLFTVIFVAVVLLLSKLLKGLARGVLGKRRDGFTSGRGRPSTWWSRPFSSSA